MHAVVFVGGDGCLMCYWYQSLLSYDLHIWQLNVLNISAYQRLYPQSIMSTCYLGCLVPSFKVSVVYYCIIFFFFCRSDLNLTFEESVFGGKQEVEVPCLETCGVCGGTGAKSTNCIKSCTDCGGRGRVMKSQRTPFGVVSQVTLQLDWIILWFRSLFCKWIIAITGFISSLLFIGEFWTQFTFISIMKSIIWHHLLILLYYLWIDSFFFPVKGSCGLGVSGFNKGNISSYLLLDLPEIFW